MKKIRLLPLVIISLMMFHGCEKPQPVELPPPVIKGDTDKTDNPDQSDQPGTPDKPDDQGGQTSHPWDANRGKVVTPSGANWKSKVIDEGVTYYTFDGKEDISGVRQQIFIIDLDLSKTQYSVKLVYTSPRKVTSAAFALESGTVAAMNANYEPASIYIRVNKILYSGLPNSNISDTGVPNWKSEGAVAFDRERGVKFYYAGSQKKGDVTVAQQRTYYNAISTTVAPDLISSAPTLIDDYNPMGENFCDYTLTTNEVNKLNSEHPDRHQRVRHPRSAVALTENGHFLMIAVDGRHNNYSYGMSARELTQFLVANFNPQYALNMDGGGSTSMCVTGEGDASTHVVNYPCDNDKHDHDGERSRDVHFVIVKK